jgi:hypothetical protein
MNGSSEVSLRSKLVRSKASTNIHVTGPFQKCMIQPRGAS